MIPMVMAFMMPSQYTLETLPEPTDPGVLIRQVPERMMAVLKFSGSWSEERFQEQTGKLQEWLRKHDVKAMGDPQSRVARKAIIRTCGRCHVGIEKNYLEGVHGKDYLKGSKDVPVCTDCHSEHAILAPTDLSSRVYATKVAQVCSRCHDDERLARQYGLLTSRLKSYSDSYHGTASKFGETRVANCASCHGFHDIRTSVDPKSPINAGNLAKTCGQCHPGAGTNFAKGKIHVVSTATENKSGHVIKIAYIVLIAGLISVFVLFILADLFHRIRSRWSNT